MVSASKAMVNQREENIYTDSISKTKHLKGPWDTVRGNHDSTMSSSGASLWTGAKGLDGTAKQELKEQRGEDLSK